MSDPIALPFWLFLLLVLIAVWFLLERLFVPSVRWFLRRRIDRVLDEIGSRLDIEIRPFQLTKRRVLIDRLVYDPLVLEAVHQHAKEEDTPRELLMAKVTRYAHEIVPSFNAYFYFRIGYWLARKLAMLMYRVRVGLLDDTRLSEVDRNSTVVFVMNHRSNMDYVLVAFLAAERTALSYAVGEWAKIWPLQTLIRFMGAYFVRRNSGNPLYRVVLKQYIHMATKEGVCQALFPEGRLSRDGCLSPAKLGIFDYMLRGFDPENDRDIVFVPVGLNYERTLEDRSLLRALEPAVEKRSKWFVVRTTTGFIVRNVALMVLRKWHRFGYACVNFGTPISAREFCRSEKTVFKNMDRAQRFSQVDRFGRKVMAAIQGIVPILPLSIVSEVLLKSSNAALSSLEIKARVYERINRLKMMGAPVFYPRRDYELAIDMALDLLLLRRLVKENDGLFTALPENSDVLAYYANVLAHWREADDMAPPAFSEEGRPGDPPSHQDRAVE